MDVVYLGAAFALMFALYGLVLACDKLGARS